MSFYKKWRQSQIGGVALRILTIPVMAAALALGYLVLRTVQDEPTVMADIATELQAAPIESRQQARPALADARVQMHEPAALHDAPIDTYDELDPVGAGRPIAP